MGQAVGKGGARMKPVPKPLESIAGLLIPPACREHVLGDLHERYENPRQYILDAILTIPLVVLSRIRRTTDHQVLLVESCALFIAFLIAAWQGDTGFPGLAIPALAVLAGLRLGDAYAERHRSPWTPVVGVAFAYLSQAVVWLANPALLVPVPIMLKAAGTSLFLIAIARMSFQAGPQGDNLRVKRVDVSR